jgi:HD-GYP domain-containing protein (c-di-GMP phosphodiesterase class II)
LSRSVREFVEALGEALETRDAYTANHGIRVARYASEMAKHLGMPHAEVDMLRLGARSHDLGKLGIPDAILLKPGPLTEQEHGLMQVHTRIGRRIISRIPELEFLLPIVELHHENFDGSGYPYGLRTDRIPLVARIVRVADAFDAMTTDRVYRPAFSREDAIGHIRRCSGTLFDPDVVATVETILRLRAPEAGAAEPDELVAGLSVLAPAESAT